jgi:hypothetical protein
MSGGPSVEPYARRWHRGNGGPNGSMGAICRAARGPPFWRLADPQQCGRPDDYRRRRETPSYTVGAGKRNPRAKQGSEIGRFDRDPTRDDHAGACRFDDRAVCEPRMQAARVGFFRRCARTGSIELAIAYSQTWRRRQVYDRAGVFRIMPAKKHIPRDRVLKMIDRGKSFAAVADHFGVHHMTIRRIVTPGYGPKSPKPRKPKTPPDRPAWRVRITDYPDTLTAAILGDPTPQRRRLLDGVVNSVIPSGDRTPKRTADHG